MNDCLLDSRYDDDQASTYVLNDIQTRARDAVIRKMESGAYRLEIYPCATCGGDSFDIVAKKDRYGLPLSAAVCTSCGLLQTNPRMDTQSCKEFYEQEYRPLYVGKPGPDDQFFNGQILQGERIESFLESNMILDWRGLRVLEVGCGAGGILSHFKSLGATVKGCDLGPEYLEYGREHHVLDLQKGPINGVDHDAPYDLIIYSHVFEHVLDPLAELEEVKKLLAPQGRLFLEVPGIHNIRNNYRCDFLRLLQNAHVFHFTLSSLNHLLRRGGFQLVAGTEYVQAIYRHAPDEPFSAQSDYAAVMAGLKKYERLRPVSRYLPGNIMRVIRLNLKRLTGAS